MPSHRPDDKQVQLYTLSDWLVLPTLVFSQFSGTSIWFAPNAVLSEIDSFEEGQISTLVSCVQAGFIIGTLILTVLRASDRVSPPILFMGMTITGSVLNLLCITTTQFAVWAVLRLLVGVCLAGVYPVGMKIAAVEYPTGLGARLGVLVGALTLGTAFPWLVRAIGEDAGLPFEVTLASVSAIAFIGALLLAVVMLPRDNFRGGGFGSETLRLAFECCFRTKRKDEEQADTDDQDHKNEMNCPTDESKSVPSNQEVLAMTVSTIHSSSNNKIDIEASPKSDDDDIARIDQNLDKVVSATDLTAMEALKAMVASSPFRAAAIGYFGHMWELYAMWTFVPVLIDRYSEQDGGEIIGNESMLSFLTIGIGFVSCCVTGICSLHAGRNIFPGSAVVAMVNLIVSLGCCLLVPLYRRMSRGVFLFFLLVWGWAVVADSAQFSSLTAMYACKGLVGTSLTLTTCVGFFITVVSIQIIGALIDSAGMDPGNAMSLLAIGPVIGVFRTYKEWPLHRLCQNKILQSKSNDMEGETVSG
jgi:MFS family permease